jgi:hypothetical protein
MALTDEQKPVITYKILSNMQMTGVDSGDDYHGIEVYIDAKYETQFTGFLRRDLLESLLRGEGVQIK